MLKPTEKLIKNPEKYGFKKCKGTYGKAGCYYLCISRGCSMIFLSPQLITIFPWEKSDPRIHDKPNCRYKDTRDAVEIIVCLSKDDLIEYV